MRHLVYILTCSVKPPLKWNIPVIFALGVFSGLGMFVFYISKAHSYLSDDPQTCVNCHIMAPQYSTWFHSAHREWTNCTQCHVPQDNIFSKYYFKAKDGLRHSTVFTLRNEPQVIFIKEEGEGVVHQNCIYCHTELLRDDKMILWTEEFQDFREERSCLDCHRETPHGRVNSLSSVPYARVPLPESPVPEWLKQITTKN